jgi:hypothetical protein
MLITDFHVCFPVKEMLVVRPRFILGAEGDSQLEALFAAYIVGILGCHAHSTA